jgi:hypothetical protein
MCQEHYLHDKLTKKERIAFNQDYRKRRRAGEPLLKRGRKPSRHFSKAHKNKLIREAESRFGLIYCRACENLKPADDMVKNHRVKSGYQRICKKCKSGNKLWRCYKCGVFKEKGNMRPATSLSHKTKIHICTECPVEIQVRLSYKKAFDADHQFALYIRGGEFNSYFAKAMGWFLRHNDELKSSVVGYDQWRWSYIDETLLPVLKNQPNNIKLEVKTDKWRNLPFNCGEPDIEPNGYTFDVARDDWLEYVKETKQKKAREYRNANN